MSDVIEMQTPDAAKIESLKTISWVSYILHTTVAVAVIVPGIQSSALVLLVALIIDLVKRSDAQGTWLASHFSWRIRSVLWAILLYVVTLPLWFLFVFPGWLAWGVISLWFLYRVVRGLMAMNDNRAVGV